MHKQVSLELGSSPGKVKFSCSGRNKKNEVIFQTLKMNEQEKKGSGLCKQTAGLRNFFCPQFLDRIAEPNLYQSPSMSTVINKAL